MLKTISISILTALLIAACGNNNNNSATSGNISSQDTTSGTSAQPVETRDPNTSYKPAFAGQTRIKGVKTQTPYEAKVITADLRKPWGIAIMPDGRLLITEKEGTMRIATAEGQLSAPITGLPPVNSRGQGGLLGLTLDPQFANNKMCTGYFLKTGRMGP